VRRREEARRRWSVSQCLTVAHKPSDTNSRVQDAHSTGFLRHYAQSKEGLKEISRSYSAQSKNKDAG